MTGPALAHLGNSVRSLRAARTSLYAALTTSGLNATQDDWDALMRLDESIRKLARREHIARTARLEGRA